MKIELSAENTKRALVETLINILAQEHAFAQTMLSIVSDGDEDKFNHFMNEMNIIRKVKVQEITEAFYAEYGELNLEALLKN